MPFPVSSVGRVGMCKAFKFESFEPALALLQRSNTCPEQEVQRLWMLLKDSLFEANGALAGPNLELPEGANSTLGRMVHLVPTGDVRVATNFARMDELLQQARNILRDLTQRADQLHSLIQDDLRQQRAQLKARKSDTPDNAEKAFPPAKPSARPVGTQSLRVNRREDTH